jgi:cell division control protein 7
VSGFDRVTARSAGSFGQLYSARCKFNRSTVALKRLHAGIGPETALKELKALNRVSSHPNIVPCLGMLRNSGTMVFMFPFFEHQSFEDYYRKMNLADLQSYMRQLFSGLQHVHLSGLIHRDIKPANILYNIHSHKLMLVDFGLAHPTPVLRQEPHLSNTG